MASEQVYLFIEFFIDKQTGQWPNNMSIFNYQSKQINYNSKNQDKETLQSLNPNSNQTFRFFISRNIYC